MDVPAQAPLPAPYFLSYESKLCQQLQGPFEGSVAHPGSRKDEGLEQYAGSLEGELCAGEDAEREEEERDGGVFRNLVEHVFCGSPVSLLAL